MTVREIIEKLTTLTSPLRYSDGIAAARTLIAVHANSTAVQRRLPAGWVLAPYDGDDLRGKAFRGANLLLPFHEVYGVHAASGPPPGLSQVSYVAFISQARRPESGTLTHLHWHAYTEDPAGVPGKYRDSKLAQIRRAQSFIKERRGETEVRESFSAAADDGSLELSLSFRSGGLLVWATADHPNLELVAAREPSIERWYQEDQVIDVVRSDPMGLDRVSEISLRVTGDLEDVFDGSERIVGVAIQRPYMRRVHVPTNQ